MIDQSRADFDAWAAQQYGQQAFRHTSACSGGWQAWQAGIAAERKRCSVPAPSAEPVATLHDDGCFTWKNDEARLRYDRQRAGWRMEVYAAPPAPSAEPALAAWRDLVLDLIDDCPGLTLAQDAWLTQRVKELPAPSAEPTISKDAYDGAREDLAIWKKRALEAEALNRKIADAINGPTFMAEPVAHVYDLSINKRDEVKEKHGPVNNAPLYFATPARSQEPVDHYLRVTKDADGVWLHIKSPSGKKGAINLEALALQRGGLVGAALLEWTDSLEETKR